MTRHSDDTVAALLEDLATTHELMLVIVQRVRTVVEETAGTVSEMVKYGGIIFSQATPFCGVYAYQEHVSVEFGQGYTFEDPHGVLEGGGKYRRHIKLRSVADVQDKHLGEYVKQALS
ncbi:DUF1801 domain-containing protein [Pseudomonas sp. CCOS 191]|uniref:DUF1801 domain-containing protein n=1 Tax=Pseudomonas sp. CCOS 191 TaxID=1649877 RepID=UPI0006245A9C|nr:DUF1801 domain-containing protein [Pseudomonas sp. CCOS 191]CRI58564.1 hypothetical protein CCOS191_4028 [Pseudomonas sp. CCOS 191]